MILGVDEAGRGPVLGPLVVAGLVVDDDASLARMGVKDSKALSPKKRRELYKILKNSSFNCILTVPASAIDKYRRSMTMNRLEVLCFSSIISTAIHGYPFIHPEISSGVNIEMNGAPSKIRRIVLDAADVNEKRFGNEVLSEVGKHHFPDGVELISKHKADRDFTAVGGASILAKVTRDEVIEQLSHEIGIDIGSGYPSDPRTREFLKVWVDSNGTLPYFARASWETCRRMLDKMDQPSLFDF